MIFNDSNKTALKKLTKKNSLFRGVLSNRQRCIDVPLKTLAPETIIKKQLTQPKLWMPSGELIEIEPGFFLMVCIISEDHLCIYYQDKNQNSLRVNIDITRQTFVPVMGFDLLLRKVRRNENNEATAYCVGFSKNRNYSELESPY